MPFGRFLTAALVVFPFASITAAPEHPASWDFPDQFESAPIESLEYPALDLERLALDDEFDEAMGKPPRFAFPREISRSPVRDGVWVDLPNGESVWRLRVGAEDAVSLNFGFRDVNLPRNARLYIYSETAERQRKFDRFEVLGPYRPEINESHREFWTPILSASEAVIELNVPTRLRDRVSLELV